MGTGRIVKYSGSLSLVPGTELKHLEFPECLLLFITSLPDHVIRGQNFQHQRKELDIESSHMANDCIDHASVIKSHIKTLNP